MSKRTLIFRFLGLEASDRRLPVRRVEDKIFEDYRQRLWSLSYIDGGVLLREKDSGKELRAGHLSDLVIFYCDHEFSLYLRKISDGKLS